MHTNMFANGHSRTEVKAGLNAHQKRDTRVVTITDVILGASLLVLMRDMEQLDAAASFIAIMAGLVGLRYFIDMSNRNFYLHLLDWEAEAENERLGSSGVWRE